MPNQVGPRVAEVQNLQNQQEHKAVVERVKVESGLQQSDKSKSKKDSNNRSSMITDNLPKTSGKKRGLGFSDLENPVKRQKGHREPAKEAEPAGASSTAANMDSSMDEAGIFQILLSLFLCLLGKVSGDDMDAFHSVVDKMCCVSN